MSGSLPPGLASRFSNARELGKGAFGRVVRAVDDKLAREVAIKLLSEDLHKERELMERFLREARLGAQIKSPRVAAVYDFGVVDGQAYIVFEFVEGPTLKVHLARSGGKLPVEEATRLLGQILDGLVAVHKQGIVHRDLKPDNILLAHGRDAVLADFGLGREVSGGGLTRTGVVVGTAQYMAPEQMRGGAPSFDWDLYAAGVIFYKLVTGKPPFTGDSFTDLYANKLKGLEHGLSDQGFPVPASIDHVLDRLLAPTQEDRARDARLAREALDDAFVKASGLLPVPSRSDPGSAPASGPSEVAASTRGLAPIPGTSAERAAGRRLPLGPLLAILGGLGVMFAARGFFPEPGSEVLPSRATPPADGPAQWRNALNRMRIRVETHPEIRESLGAPGNLDADTALELWIQARSAWQEATEGLPDLAAKLSRTGLTPGLHDDAVALALVERLLSVTRHKGIPPLAPGPSGLQRILAQGSRIRREPRLDGYFPEDWRERQRELRRDLGGGVRRFHTLRAYQDLLVTRDSGTVLRPWVVRTTVFGTRFEDSSEGFGDVLRGGARSMLGEDLTLTSPDELRLPFEPVEGDLELLLAVQGWDETSTGVLEVLGSEATARFLLVPPVDDRAPRREGRISLVGLGLRLSRTLLPAAARSLRFTVRGVEQIGTPVDTVRVEEIYQRVQGPPLPDLDLGLP